MHPSRTRVGQVLALCFAVLPLMAAGPVARPGQALRFASVGLAFHSAAVAFRSTALAFPSHLQRTEKASSIEVVLPADVLFDFDKAELRPDAAASMREVAGLMRTRASGPVAIRGYTDAVGGDAYNQRLSERRASAVKAWFVQNEKFAAARFNTAGLGARDPVAPNRRPDGSDDPEGRQRNRRVTITILK